MQSARYRANFWACSTQKWLLKKTEEDLIAVWWRHKYKFMFNPDLSNLIHFWRGIRLKKEITPLYCNLIYCLLSCIFFVLMMSLVTDRGTDRRKDNTKVSKERKKTYPQYIDICWYNGRRIFKVLDSCLLAKPTGPPSKRGERRLIKHRNPNHPHDTAPPLPNGTDELWSWVIRASTFVATASTSDRREKTDAQFSLPIYIHGKPL